MIIFEIKCVLFKTISSVIIYFVRNRCIVMVKHSVLKGTMIIVFMYSYICIPYNSTQRAKVMDFDTMHINVMSVLTHPLIKLNGLVDASEQHSNLPQHPSSKHLDLVLGLSFLSMGCTLVTLGYKREKRYHK